MEIDRHAADVVELVVGDRIRGPALRTVDGVEADPAEGDVRDGQRRPAHYYRVLLDVPHGATRVMQRAVYREAIIEADRGVGEGGRATHADASPIAARRRRARGRRRGFLNHRRVEGCVADGYADRRIVEAGEGGARGRQRSGYRDRPTEDLDLIAVVRGQRAADGQAAVEQVAKVITRNAWDS